VCDQGHVTHLIGETMHFKFRMLFDTEEYWCMHDRLPPKGMCSGSRELFKFWETMQDKDIGNRMWPIEWHHYR